METIMMESAIIRQRGTEVYTGVVRWEGGMRFEQCPTIVGARLWIERNLADIKDSFEVLEQSAYLVDGAGAVIRTG